MPCSSRATEMAAQDHVRGVLSVSKEGMFMKRSFPQTHTNEDI